jgi:hypothetical protein
MDDEREPWPVAFDCWLSGVHYVVQPVHDDGGYWGFAFGSDGAELAFGKSFDVDVLVNQLRRKVKDASGRA